ncbi:MAG: hypothetical protein PHI59_03825 [Candidatus Omnitrophica bacterium]|nr:hypothetical protein [Candidatus Omnitrophota bacterium]
MKYKIFISAIIFYAIGFLACREASAFSINVSPPSLRLSVLPGETNSGTITVDNKSDTPMDIRVYTEDWIYMADGSKKFVPAGTTPLSCAKWIATHPQKLHIEANSRMGVQYTVSMPPDAEGGYYAVIFFESIVNEGEAARGNVMLRFAGRIGTIVYLEAEGRVKKVGSITSFTCGRPDQNSPLAINLTMKNEGNTYIIAEGVANIIDKDGNIFGRKELGPINTFPGDTRDYKAEWMGDLKEGTYDVIATIDAGVDIPLVAETVLTVTSSGVIDKLDINAGTNQPSFNIVVNNTGNLNVKIEGKVDILNDKGEVAQSIPVKGVLVAPNSQKEIQAKSETALGPGKYKARAVVMFGDKELTKEGEFSIK